MSRSAAASSWNDAAPPRISPWWLALLFALLGMVLLHGCHGEEEDHELFRGSPPESPWIVN